MFYTIPVNNKQIVTSTPLGVKAITHVFFENKNDGVFTYKRDIDTITITVGGKMICRQVPVMPFCTSVPYGVNQHNWQDVALEVGLNVNLSEIKISASNTNDFNVVFVCEDKELKETNGYDFVEWQRIEIKKALTQEEADEYCKPIHEHCLSLLKTFNADEALITAAYNSFNASSLTTEQLKEFNKLEKKLDKQKWYFENINKVNSEQEAFGRYYELLSKGRIERPWGGTDPGDLFGDYFRGSQYYMDWGTISSGGRKVAYYDTYFFDLPNKEPYVLSSYRAFTSANIPYQWGKEERITLDKAPERMFLMQLGSSTIDHVKDPQQLFNSDIALNMSFTNLEHTELPANSDVLLMQTTDNLPWRKVQHVFRETMPRTIQYSLNYNSAIDRYGDKMPLDVSRGWGYTNKDTAYTWDMYAIFIYKKL